MAPINRAAIPLAMNGSVRGLSPALPLLSIAVLGALSLGLMSAFLPWFILIPLVIIPIGLIVAWAVPELALLVLIAAAFGVIPEYLLPRLPIAGGVVRLEDAGVFIMLGLLLVRNVGAIR